MDYGKLIEQLREHTIGWTDTVYGYAGLRLDAARAIETLLAENSILRKMQPVELSGDAATSFALAQEVSRLRAELENEHAHRIHAEQHADAFLRDCEQLNAELERVTAERDGAKSTEVREAINELMEFARTRMCTADWLYYVEVLGEWSGIKED